MYANRPDPECPLPSQLAVDANGSASPANRAAPHWCVDRQRPSPRDADTRRWFSSSTMHQRDANRVALAYDWPQSCTHPHAGARSGGAWATLTLSGCGATNGFFTQAQQNYTITITATAGSHMPLKILSSLPSSP